MKLEINYNREHDIQYIYIFLKIIVNELQKSRIWNTQDGLT